MKSVFQNLCKLNNNIKIKYKNESFLMKLLGKILFFNKGFMTQFVTTIGTSIYFPSKKYVEENNLKSAVILAHELVHVNDFKNLTGVLFSFLYLFPMTLAPFMWLFAFIHWGLGLSLFLLFLLPLPAPFRTFYELKGYTMSLFIHNELYKKYNYSYQERKYKLYELANNYNKQFIGSNYYFMWPFGVKDILIDRIDEILSDVYLEDDFYKNIASAFK